MKKKVPVIIQSVVFLLLTSAMAFSLYPSLPALAQGTCQPITNLAPIRLDPGGFLSVADTTIISRFYTTDKYLCGKPAAVPQFSIPSYDEMKSIYFDQTKLPIQQKITLSGKTDYTQADLSLTDQDKIYYVPGNLNLSSNIPGNFSGVFFIDGNLLINPTNGRLTTDSNGLVFIVRGNVNISQSASQIDSLIITSGLFCSSWDGNLCSAFNRQLTINGSVITLDATKQPQFMRTNGNNTEPAETINYAPKYLVILKDIFARDLAIWSEL